VREQPNNLDGHVGQLDESVERLTSEVASLKLELATLVSALREIQHQQSDAHEYRAAAPRPVPKIEPPVRPSPAPAAVVVLLAAGLLSWQLIMGPRPERADASPKNAAATVHAAEATTPLPPIEVPATEPPVTPLVRPTIYKGTLAINADLPGATVFVNREPVGTAPVRIRNLKAGAHLVWVERDGYRRWTRVVTVPAEQVTRVSADLEPLDPVIEH
jgi:hypothetical protein